LTKQSVCLTPRRPESRQRPGDQARPRPPSKPQARLSTDNRGNMQTQTWLTKLGCERFSATSFYAGLCLVLTRCIALLDTSRRRSRVNRACLQLVFRMRAALLLLSHRHSVPNWTHTRLLLVLIDPVSAGLWPHVRRNKGLTPMQQFARWIVIRANPMAEPAVSRQDLLRILRVFRSALRKRGPEIQSNPLIKNQFNECCSKQIISHANTHNKGE